MALGELQLKPDEFWRLTSGELMAIIRGFVVRRDMESANHRNLYTVFCNANRVRNTAAKKAKDLWPLDIDYDSDKEMSMEEKQKLFSKIANNGEIS